MSSSGALAGLRVVVARPDTEPAQLLCARIQDAGGTPLLLPVMDIEAIDCTRTLTPALLAAPDWAVFTSVNAVTHALAQLPADARWPAGITAIGAATANALAAAGLPPSVMPVDPYTSESLLQQLAQQPMDGKTVLLISGEGGRDALVNGLTQRGARVHKIPVYRRVAGTLCAARVGECIANANVLLITSGEGLTLLQQHCPASHRQQLQQQALVVPSQRVLKMAREAGFTGRIVVAKPMSETGIMQALGRIRNRE